MIPITGLTELAYKSVQLSIKGVKPIVALESLAKLSGKTLTEVMEAIKVGMPLLEKAAEAISKIKSGVSNIINNFKRIVRDDGYYEFTTSDGIIFRMADSEIPVASRSIVQKSAEIFTKFTSVEINNLKNVVIKEGQALKYIHIRGRISC